MIPTPHVCCKCKNEVVWTDCLPALCYKCSAREREEARAKMENDPVPIIAGRLAGERKAIEEAGEEWKT